MRIKIRTVPSINELALAVIWDKKNKKIVFLEAYEQKLKHIYDLEIKLILKIYNSTTNT